MAPLPRRIPQRAAPAAQVAGGTVNFGDDSFYLAGLGLPEGDYALTHHTQMFQPTKQNGQPTGQPFLCVMMTCYPLAGGDPVEHPLGCGQKAHESFVPSEDGKGFEPVPGGPAIGMTDMSNWAIYRKSLKDCGLPDGILTNDLSVLDGIWVHTRNIPEPEERKSFGTRTGEAALDPNAQRSKTVVVVTEIKEDGKPWEGTGGIPEGGAPVAQTGAPARVAGVARPVVRTAAAAPAPAARAAAARPAAAAGPRRAAPAPVAPAPAGEVTEEELRVSAINGIGAHLEKFPNGCTKVQLRTGTFAAISKAEGEDMANAVLETYFTSDEALTTVLGEVGYMVGAGARITPLPA